MTVLVTGGSGLVGSHVIEALRARGEAVRALVRAPSPAAVAALGAEPVVGDVTDPAAWRRAAEGVRGIVHAAALVQQRAGYDAFEAVNVWGTRLAVQAARASGARLVYISSVAVYGGTAAYQPGPIRRTEDFPFQPLRDQDFYARTKRLAEELMREEAARGGGGFTAVAIRPNVIYGERDRLFTPKVVRAIRLGFVPLVGSGTNRLSCVYAGNVAAAVVAALDAPVPPPGFRAYNATNDAPPELSEREFIAAFADALGASVRRPRVPASLTSLGLTLWTLSQRLRHPTGYVGFGRAALSFVTGDNPYVSDRARDELGWRPPFTTREAIARTARWFLENEKPGTRSRASLL